MPNILHVLIEGGHDESFVDRVIKPWLIRHDKYSDVIPFAYARRKKEIIENYITTINQKGEEIICLTDSTHAPCISGRLEHILKYKIGTFEQKAIFVAVKEMEGWYLAGFDNNCCRRCRIRYVERTDQITKDDFHELIAKSRYRNRPALRYEILGNFDLQLASTRNKSFYRFFNRFLNKH